MRQEVLRDLKLLLYGMPANEIIDDPIDNFIENLASSRVPHRLERSPLVAEDAGHSYTITAQSLAKH